MELEATKLTNCYAIRPKGQLGTCGFSPKAWQVFYVAFKDCRSESHAIELSKGKVF